MYSEDILRQSVEVLLFLFSKSKNREQKKEDYTMDKKEYFLYVKGKAVKVRPIENQNLHHLYRLSLEMAA